MKIKVFTLFLLSFCITFFSSSKDKVAKRSSSFSFNCAKYQTDANGDFEVWSSNNSLTSWQQVGTAVTSSTTSLTKASTNLSISKSAPFHNTNTSGSRLNIDDIDYQEYVNSYARDDNMAMGNPSNATTSPNNMNNYLMK